MTTRRMTGAFGPGGTGPRGVVAGGLKLDPRDIMELLQALIIDGVEPSNQSPRRKTLQDSCTATSTPRQLPHTPSGSCTPERSYQFPWIASLRLGTTPHRNPRRGTRLRAWSQSRSIFWIGTCWRCSCRPSKRTPRRTINALLQEVGRDALIVGVIAASLSWRWRELPCWDARIWSARARS